MHTLRMLGMLSAKPVDDMAALCLLQGDEDADADEGGDAGGGAPRATSRCVLPVLESSRAAKRSDCAARHDGACQRQSLNGGLRLEPPSQGLESVPTALRTTAVGVQRRAVEECTSNASNLAP